jgi:hypothetical protein
MGFRTLNLARTIGDNSSGNSIGLRFRRARIAPLLDMISQIHRAKGRCSIIDIGGRKEYWSIVPEGFLSANRVSITITNIEEGSVEKPEDGIFKFEFGDGRQLNFDDKSFDIAHSNSVIEHVGRWEDMIKFSKEVSRVGHAYFVQTPNFWFPFEPHVGVLYFQCLPTPWKISLLMKKERGFFPKAATIDDAKRAIESCELLDERMMRFLFSDGEIQKERFAGMIKSFVAIRRPDAAEDRAKTLG